MVERACVRSNGVLAGATLSNAVLSNAFRFALIGVAATLAGSPVFGQTASTPNGPPFAQPMLGQVTANDAVSVVAEGNADRISVTPSLNTVYDTNVLRRAQPDGTDTSNFRTTPNIKLVMRRSFGRLAINANGSAGYDFNSRYRFLNRSRIDLAGNVKAPVGAICSANLAIKYDQYQFELDDVTQTLGATTRNQDYDIALGCQRSAGFSPVAGATYHTASSGNLSLFNFNQLSGRGGIAYAKPSIGIVTLTAAASKLRRPNIGQAVDANDSTDVRVFTISLDRAVSQRVQLNLAAGYTEAKPNRVGVQGFAGLSFNGRINWNIVPLFSLTGTASREVNSQNGISATYVIRDEYVTSVNWQLSHASQVSLLGSRVNRDLRGEVRVSAVTPLLADRTTSISAAYRYNTSRRIQLGLRARRQWRTADNPIYTYRSTIISGSLGTRF